MTRWGRHRAAWVIALVAGSVAGVLAAPPTTPTNVVITGGASPGTQRLPTGQSQFGLRVPLKPNAENVMSVEAADTKGNSVRSAPFTILQLTLTDIVTARVEATRLTVPEIKQLVADGVIDVADPENFNVSRFVIVLTVGGREVPVEVPVVQGPEEPMGTGAPISIGCAGPGQGLELSERVIRVPCGGGGGGGAEPPKPVDIVPFVIDVPDQPSFPPIPGVIVIDGRIKTLKEFYRVNLILTNVSQIFTLSHVEAVLEVPEDALTPILPAAGPVMIDDVPPGTEKTGSFIIRGDRIGIHTVTAHFAALLTGLGITEPIPISGSASTDVEVKGPPQLGVRVSHPDFVQAGVPYELTVEITNTDPELPALYTSFELEVGADSRLLDNETGLPRTTASVEALGDLLPGDSAVRTYRILPLATGPITSCTAGVTQNISLSMHFVGGNGPRCAIGTFPPEVRDPDGRPTVTVVPTHNTVDVTIDPAIVALFSAPMLAQTITTGFNEATFLLLDEEDTVVPSTLQLSAVTGGNSLAILRPIDVLRSGHRYTVLVRPDIFDTEGRGLAAGLTARFRTVELPPLPDAVDPTASLTIQPPVTPASVPRGQLVPVEVVSSDNRGVTRVDLLLDGALVDSRVPSSPVHFMVDTAALVSGSTHELEAVAVDAAGNHGTDTATFTITPDTTPPTVQIVTRSSVQRGRFLPISVNAADDGTVARVDLFVDGGATPFFTGRLAPFGTSLATNTLGGGLHTLRAVAVDGAGNSAETTQPFTVIDDTVPPAIVILSPVAGQQVASGTQLAVTAVVTDNVLLGAVRYFLDAEGTPRTSDPTGFILATASVADGPHVVRVEAEDVNGNASSSTASFSVFTVPPDTIPPPVPDVTKISIGLPMNDLASVMGATGAVEAGARVEITNLATQAILTPVANGSGWFQATVVGVGGDVLQFVAIDLAGNRSPAATIPIPVPPTLESILVTPASVQIGRLNPQQQLTVTGVFSDASQAPITVGRTFTVEHPDVATVTSGGLVQPIANGTTSVQVSVAGVPPVVVPIVVDFPTTVGIEVDPASVVILDVGLTRQLAVRAVLSDGARQTYGGSVMFSSANPGIVTVSSTGFLVGTGPGMTEVHVLAPGFPMVTVPVTVERATRTSLNVSPGSFTFIGAGQSGMIAVTANFTDGSVRAVPDATFASNAPAIASVDAAGLVTSGANGTTTIDVMAPGVATRSIPVTVKTLVAIDLTPATATLIGTGAVRQLSVVGVYSDTSTTSVAPTFTSNATGVATVNGAGLVTATGLGQATITAMVGALSDTAVITVIARAPEELVVAPAGLLFTAAGQTTSLVASIRFNDGTTGAPVDPVTFQSNNTQVATVDSAGVVTSVANGSTSIMVSSGLLDASVPVTVDIPPVVPPPVIGSIDRPRAGEGDPFVIRGSNFSGVLADVMVEVNGVLADVIAVRSDEITAIVPAGATTGPVTVDVRGQTSNALPITIYARRARSIEVTPGIDQPGTTLNLPPIPPLDVRAGDRVYLSSAPDVLAPITFTGSLEARVAGGMFMPVPLTVDASDLTALFMPGLRTLELRLTGAGGQLLSGPIWAVFGPDGTGPIAGEHGVIALNQTQTIPVTFLDLRDFANQLVPDGAKVVVSTAGACTHRDRAGFCVDSRGGRIVGGDTAPGFEGNPAFRLFTVMGGRIDVQYDSFGTEVGVAFGATARVTVVPANASGVRIGNHSYAVEDVTLATIDTASTSRSQSAVIADGFSKIVTITIGGIRDSRGEPVPDGAQVLASTLGGCTHRDSAGFCLNSAGGRIVNGDTAPGFVGALHTRLFTVMSGGVTVQYDPGDVTVRFEAPTTANVQMLPARSDGTRIGDRTFAIAPIALTSPFTDDSAAVANPPSVLADSGDRRSTITVTGIRDFAGNPAPDGTKVLVSCAGGCTWRDRAGFCLNSIGGVIVNGAESPSFGGNAQFRVLEVQNGTVQIVYAAQGVALEVPQSGTATVTVLPATPIGNPIGTYAFVHETVTVSAFSTSTAASNPTIVVADGLSKPVTVTFSGVVDASGVTPPDGAKVLVSTAGGCTWRDRAGFCVDSAGGLLVGGAESPHFGTNAAFRVFSVMSGSVTVTYDPAAVAVPVGEQRTARIMAIPARPDGTPIGIRAFGIAAVTLSPPTSMTSSVVPATVLADGNLANQVVATVSGITDVQGMPVIDGTKVVASVAGGCTHRDPAGFCVESAGGTLLGGTDSPELGANGRVLTVQNGQVQVAYRAAPTLLGSPFTGTARIVFLPATPAGGRVGQRGFIVVEVGLTSPFDGTITGPGSLTPGASGSYVVSDLVDTSGNPLPDGTTLFVSTFGACTHRDRNGFCIDSSGGAVTGGAATPEFGANVQARMFIVANGSITFGVQAPASGTTVVHVLPATPSGARIGQRAFTLKAIAVQP